MPLDYKKEYKEIYMPKNKPSIITIPKMNFVSYEGKGNPNEEDGEYKKSLQLLYAISFTIKMSYKGSYRIKDYFEYVVPPLEGLWWQEGLAREIDYNKKDDFHFISIIRLPDFVTIDDFNWAINEVKEKKGLDVSNVKFLTYDEGLCVQCMHIGSYDNEPETIKMMNEYVK